MSLNPRTRFCCCIFLVGFLVGCSEGSTRSTQPVAGEVTLDGQPLPKGEILFEPLDSSLSPEAGEVVDGRFSMQAPEGPNTVRITALRDTAKTEVGAMGESLAVTEQYLPARYNVESDLKVDTPAGGKLDFKFDLQSNEPR